MNKAKDIQEGNKLIAEFMGGKFRRLDDGFGNISEVMYFLPGNNPNPHCTAGTYKRIEELEYEKRWDWLMPVVEKIEKQLHESIIFRIYDKRAVIDIDTQAAIAYDIELVSDFYSGYCETKIEAAYKTAIEFIKWYNQNKTS